MDELTLFRNKCITVAITVIAFWVITDWMYEWDLVNDPFLVWRFN